MNTAPGTIIRMNTPHVLRLVGAFAILASTTAPVLPAQSATLTVPLAYRSPVEGHPKPNFSPKGMQVPLKSIASTAVLPAGSTRPAKTGMIKVGPDQRSWIPVLVTSDAEHPRDLTRLFVDANRNGNFNDDGAGMLATLSQNAKTKAWWSSVNKVELQVPFGNQVVEPYLVNFWIVREDSADAPDILRFSTGSWRYGTVSVNGVNALVAAMDGDNDAMFTKSDMWSVLAASDSNAAQAVLSIAEARSTNRLMFVTSGAKEQVIEFRSFSPDGRSMTLAVIEKGITKSADRGPDDLVREERTRPRATVPFKWQHGSKGLTGALAAAKTSGKKILLDFEATWCGPCHTMDQWIWNDAEVAGELNSGFLGVKIDVDLEKALAVRYKTIGYPTMILLDSNGKELRRVTDYQSSRDMLAFLRDKR